MFCGGGFCVCLWVAYGSDLVAFCGLLGLFGRFVLVRFCFCSVMSCVVCVMIYFGCCLFVDGLCCMCAVVGVLSFSVAIRLL